MPEPEPPPLSPEEQVIIHQTCIELHVERGTPARIRRHAEGILRAYMVEENDEHRLAALKTLEALNVTIEKLHQRTHKPPKSKSQKTPKK